MFSVDVGDADVQYLLHRCKKTFFMFFIKV